jgi:hypothetical protein
VAVYAKSRWVNFTTVKAIEPTSCKLTLPDNRECYYEIESVTTPPLNERCNFSTFTIFYCEFEVDILSRSLGGIYTLKYNETDTTVGEEIVHVYLPTGKNIQLPDICIILRSLKALRFLIV